MSRHYRCGIRNVYLQHELVVNKKKMKRLKAMSKATSEKRERRKKRHPQFVMFAPVTGANGDKSARKIQQKSNSKTTSRH